MFSVGLADLCVQGHCWCADHLQRSVCVKNPPEQILHNLESSTQSHTVFPSFPSGVFCCGNRLKWSGLVSNKRVRSKNAQTMTAVFTQQPEIPIKIHKKNWKAQNNIWPMSKIKCQILEIMRHVIFISYIRRHPSSHCHNTLLFRISPSACHHGDAIITKQDLNNQSQLLRRLLLLISDMKMYPL